MGWFRYYEPLRAMTVRFIKGLPNGREIGNHFRRRLVTRLGFFRQGFEGNPIEFRVYSLV